MRSVPRSVDGGIDEIPLFAAPGRLFLCGKHVVGPDVDVALARVRATTVVCLTERHELEQRYPGYVAWLDSHQGREAVWAPMHDLGALPAERMRALADDIAGRLRAGEVVLMHCGAGIGRAGTAAIAVLHRLGVSLGQARATVRAHRPMAGPEAGAQEDVLRALATEP